MEPGVHLKLDGSAQSSVDAYLEYRRIVGDDDNGVLFTPDQYEEYKKNVASKRQQNRYREHKTDIDIKTATRPLTIPCKKCNCSSYNYIPLNGSQPLRCHCKHTVDDHSPAANHECSKPACNCRAFRTSFNCGCGEVVASHHTLIETKDERFDRGHPVARNEPAYAAMGGITGFSSLLDGYLRLDDSGIGPPSREFLEQPTTSTDHPFLRAFDRHGNPAITDSDRSQTGRSRRSPVQKKTSSSSRSHMHK